MSKTSYSPLNLCHTPLPPRVKRGFNRDRRREFSSCFPSGFVRQTTYVKYIMKLKTSLKHLSLAALAAGGLSVTPAMAQNTFDNGDLILGFQSIAGTGFGTSVFVNLGAPGILRTANVDGVSIDNFANVNSILTSVFQDADPLTNDFWYENTNLFVGLVGSWSNASAGSSLLDLDPRQTLYIGKPRTAVGDESLVNSTLSTLSSSNQQNAATAITGLNGTFETQLPTVDQGGVASSFAQNWEDAFPTTGAGVQNNALGSAYPDDLQSRFTIGNFGAFSLGTAEVALDLYRAQLLNSISGQFDQGGAIRTPQFQGILTLDSAGNVDFIVPEPSSALLLGVASALGLGFRRRRSAVA